MALDRTWYNSLIDDDGSGLTGSVWDKADVDSLMDAVDAEIARIDAAVNGKFAIGGYNPTLTGSSGGVPVYLAQQGYCAKSGNLVTVGGVFAISSKGSIVGTLLFGGLPYAAVGYQQGPLVMGYFREVNVNVSYITGYINPGEKFFTLQYVPGGGAINTVAMDAAHLRDGFACTFSATYITA